MAPGAPSKPTGIGMAAWRSRDTQSCGSLGGTSLGGMQSSRTASGACWTGRLVAGRFDRAIGEQSAPRLGHRGLEVLVHRGKKFLRRLELLIGADQEGEILGHLPALDRLD